MAAKTTRGRPVGWRKDSARRERILIRLTEDERGWLRARAAERGVTEVEVVRALIEKERGGHGRKN